MKLPELEPVAFAVQELDDQFTTWDFIAGWADACHEHISESINEWKDSGEVPPQYSVVKLFTQDQLTEAYAQGKKDAVPEGWTAIHLKTGNEYQVLGEAIDATNAHRNQGIVIYKRDGRTYVRESGEFQDKFKAAPKQEKT